VSEANPATQTVILETSPIVLPAGVIDNALHLNEDNFNSLRVGSPNDRSHHGTFHSNALDANFAASGDAGFAQGSASGVSAAPFFGSGADTTTYLSIGAHSSETITFDDPQNAFGLYWGSVDAGNTISFYDGNKLVASFSGNDIAPLIANGNQGSFTSNGYVEFKDLAPFDKVVLSSDANAFEVDNISAGYVADHHIQLANPVSGTLTIKDADVGDTLTALVTDPGVATYNGSTTHLPAGFDLSSLTNANAITFDSLTSNGGTEVLHWTYNPANANFDFLEPGDTLKLTFNAHVTDGTVTVGDQPLTVNIVGTNAPTVQGTDGNDVFVNVGGGVAIAGHGGNDTFQFKPGFGSATISDFSVTNDVINIDHTLFNGISDIFARAHNVGSDTVITDAAHDQITLKGVHVGSLNQQDFHLV
jgi:VCBS repeat-containing protein